MDARTPPADPGPQRNRDVPPRFVAPRHEGARPDDVASPCIGVCVLDQRTRICRGCRRTIDEIAAWSSMTDAAKRAVLRRLAGPVQDWTDEVH